MLRGIHSSWSYRQQSYHIAKKDHISFTKANIVIYNWTQINKVELKTVQYRF